MIPKFNSDYCNNFIQMVQSHKESRQVTSSMLPSLVLGSHSSCFSSPDAGIFKSVSLCLIYGYSS